MTVSGFTKLFSSIIHSTVWREDMHVKVVWITMLAMAESRGTVSASVPGLADAARVTIPQVEDALARLAAPDPYSRTKDHEGRRIEEIDGGWRLLNYGKYRESRDPEERKRQNREARRRFRAKHAAVSQPEVSQSQPEVSQGQPGSAQAEAEAEADTTETDPPTPLASRKKFSIPTPGEVQAYLDELRERRFTGQDFFDGNSARGWVVGKAKAPMKDWRAAVRTWIKWRNDQNPIVVEPVEGSLEWFQARRKRGAEKGTAS